MPFCHTIPPTPWKKYRKKFFKYPILKSIFWEKFFVSNCAPHIHKKTPVPYTGGLRGEGCAGSIGICGGLLPHNPCRLGCFGFAYIGVGCFEEPFVDGQVLDSGFNAPHLAWLLAIYGEDYATLDNVLLKHIVDAPQVVTLILIALGREQVGNGFILDCEGISQFHPLADFDGVDCEFLCFGFAHFALTHRVESLDFVGNLLGGGGYHFAKGFEIVIDMAHLDFGESFG